MRYAFGDFELDTEAYELRRAGKRIKVQPKVFHLLRHLIQNRTRFVSKEEILAALWPNEHVTDSSLFVCVRAVRAALDQHHSENRPIATLRGTGYRFVADVTETQEARPSALPKAAEPESGEATRDEFVGRQNVMYALSSALGRATAGRGQFVMLSGEPGIGKTRCAEALADLASRDRIRVLTARCLEADGAPAYWPWIQLLRQAAESSDSSTARAEARSLLELLVPAASAAERAAGSEPRTDWSADRFWLFDRVVRVLTQIAEWGPCLIVLDDLQWADDSSLRLLQLLVADLARMQCLIVATVREPRPGADEARERALRRLARSATVLELQGLSPAETAQLVSAVAGAASAAVLAPELHQKTAGNPFFLGELLRLRMTSTGEGRGERVPSGNELPRVVRDVIRGRLDELEAQARAVLRAASVFGGEFDLGVLGRVVELGSDDFFAAVDVALDARLLRQGTQADRFAFTHDLVREVIHGDLSQAERVRFHRRAGEALEARAAGDGWQSEVAYHFHQALADGVHEKALQFASSAANAAMSVLAFDTAARCCRWALAALDYHPRDQPRRRAELTVNLGVSVLGEGRSTEAREILRAAVEIAERQGYGDLLAVAATWLRHNIATAPMPDPFSLHVLQRALDLLEPRQAVLRVSVISRLAWIFPNCEDMPKCKALAAEALALARTLHAEAPLLDALAATLYSQSGPDDVDALLATADEVLELERRNGTLTWATGQAHFMRYHALLLRHRAGEADRALDEFGTVVRKLRLPEPILLHDRMCAQRSFYQGRFAEAEAQFAEQHVRGKRLGLGYADLYYGIQTVTLLWEREGLGELPLSSATDGWNMFITPIFRSVRLFVKASAGASTEVLSEWRALSDRDFAGIPRDLNYLNALTTLSQVAIALDDVPRARTLKELLTPYADFNTPTLLSQVVGSVAHYLGQLAHYLGEHRDAVKHFEHAVTLHERMGYAAWAARSRVGLARVLLDGADEAGARRARELVKTARATAEELGLKPVLRSCDAVGK